MPRPRFALPGMVTISCIMYAFSLALLFRLRMIYPQGANRFVLLALLLLAVPELDTLQKLVALLPLGERSHQLFAEPPADRNHMSRALAQGITLYHTADQVVRVHRVRPDQALLLFDALFRYAVGFIAERKIHVRDGGNLKREDPRLL